MTATTKQYFAFISYKRDDQKWAEWLQQKLEHYKLPSNLNGRSDLPKEIRPIFRDKSELAAGVLADEIQKALDNSKYLIVICSPHSAKSEWVNKEVQAFIESGRTDKIIPFIIEGVPNSGNDETECFPKAIRELPAEDELLGVNINEMGRDAAAVKVVAQMFGLRFDDLWNRHEREQRRRRRWFTVGIVTFVLMVLGVAGWIWHQNTMLKKQRWQMLENQSRFVSEKVYSEISNNPDLAQNIATVILPKDIENPDRPYTAEAERVLRKTYEYKSCVVKKYDNSLFAESKFSEDGTKFLNRRRWDMLHPTLVILDAETGIELQRIESSDYGCADIRIDGKQAIMMNDSVFKIIDMETGAEIRTFDQYDNLQLVSYISDDIVILCNEQGQRFYVNTTTGQELLKDSVYEETYSLKTCSEAKKCFYYKEDDNNNETTIEIVDIDDFEAKQSLVVDEKCEYKNIIYNYDGTILLTCSQKGVMTLWDVETGNKIKTIDLSDSDMIFPLAFSPDGKLLATGHLNGIVKIWEIETLNIVGVFESGGTGRNYFYAKFSPDGKKLAVCSNNIIKIVEVDTNVKSNVIAKVEGVANNYDKSDSEMVHDNVIYYDYYGDAGYYIYNIKTKIGTQRTMEPHELYWLSDNKYRFYIMDNSIAMYDDTNDDTLYKFMIEKDIRDVKISPDRKRLCILSYYDCADTVENLKNVEINVFDMETGVKIDCLQKKLYADGDYVSIRSLSYDNKHIALLYGHLFYMEIITHGFIILNLNTGEETARILNDYQDEACLSPDGSCVLTYSDMYTSSNIIWDATSGVKITEVDGVVKNQYPFSPDGHHILSKIDHIKYNVYDVKTGNCVHTIESENDTLIAASFTDDGRHIITVSTNGNVCQWDFPPLQELIDQTRERFKNRPLTEEERKMYYLE